MKVALRNKITGLHFDGVNFSASLENAKLFDDSRAIRERANSLWSNAEVVEVAPKKHTIKSIRKNGASKLKLKPGDFITATGGWFHKDIVEIIERNGFKATPCQDEEYVEFRRIFKTANWPFHILRIRETA